MNAVENIWAHYDLQVDHARALRDRALASGADSVATWERYYASVARAFATADAAIKSLKAVR